MKRLLIVFIFIELFTLYSKSDEKSNDDKRFFSENSFWNLPIEVHPEIDERSLDWIALLKTEPNTPNIGINVFQWRWCF